MGIYLSEPKKEKQTLGGENGQFEFASSGMQGWRMSMEDSHISELDIDKDTHIFGVFDGHGGREVAQFVSKYFIPQLKNTKEFKEAKIKQALIHTFLKMDEMLRDDKYRKELMSYKEKEGEDGESMAGCTANVIVIKDKIIYCANAGDTRCCLSNNGKLVRMSKDHKPDNEIEKQRITEAGGFISEGRVNANLNLSRALGDLEYKKNENIPPEKQLISAYPDVTERKIDDKDEFILIGCDGIWETQTSPDIITWIRNTLKTTPIKTLLENMLDWLIAPDTRSGAGCDNMSAILVRIK